MLRAILTAALLGTSVPAADVRPPSPALEILRPGGPPLTLTQYKGKVVVLAFILTTCSHCQEFTLLLNKVAPEYTGRGVQFLECAFNEGAAGLLGGFEARFHPAYPVGYTSQAAVNTYLRKPIMDTRPLYVPHLVLIDRAGRIAADIPGQDAFFHNAEPGLRKMLEDVLKPAPAVKK